MKLTEKYEILEFLTSGRVSTFVARERATQEQVLVHTFECAGPNPPADTASILGRFSSIAPNPPGIVLKAGLDDSSSSAYLITRMPDQAVLQEWVRAYRSLPAEGTAFARPKSQPSPSPRAAADSIEPVARPEAKSGSGQSAGEFTMLFRELGSFPASGPNRGNTAPGVPQTSMPSGPIMAPPAVSSPSAASKPEGEPGEITKLFSAAKKRAQMGNLGSATDAGTPDTKPPGEFTKQFRAVTDQFARPAATPTPAIEARTPAKPVPSSPFSTDIFGPGTPQPATTPFGTDAHETKSGGEFTNFFRNPFDQPAASSKPIVVPDEPPIRPAREQVGDFTRVFGKGGSMESGEMPTPVTPIPEPPKSAGSFTQLFGRDAVKPPAPVQDATPPAPVAMPMPIPIPPAPEPPRVAAQVASPMPTPVPFPSPVIPPIIPVAPNPLVASPAVAPVDVPAGEAPRAKSEFTMFITRKDLDAALAPPPAEDAATPPPASPFAFPAAPPLPKPPAPKPPAPPKPKIEAPKPAAGTAPPLSSLWPLITVFTVLLAIGAILVMYFLLRH